ncbi:5-formyltetrahydrofolate cyclo-ligase [Solibacillus sp. MA9]|uniref:5-formyltetrahydrofolate cyclo-ligase n=1 Tax=Solibacillus palustris TaxID=2908203 RepID=A0ABS9UCK4_9BACL|nr:5-formyltetrahydrofolate cyclo-ligase [Solibacillus sp. MA9]MCH7321730.1 5-formyltetrahydrofolate cyclo-ligase [Solibacillus sp. MA9]
MDKKQLRNTVLQQLNDMSYQQYRDRSYAIAQNLLQQPAIIDATMIGITLSNKPEVDTSFIIEQLWKMNKKVAVPKCAVPEHAMQFYEIDTFAQTERAYKNILEPIPEFCDPVEKQQIDVIVVPGVVFDDGGYRIGFGGGYYDRYLQGYNGMKIALAFDEQLINKVPRESHDLPVHILVGEHMSVICEQ